MPISLRGRRWFQFTLRGMFVAVTVAGIFSAWMVYNLNWILRGKAPRFTACSIRRH